MPRVKGGGVRPCYLTIRGMKTVGVIGRFSARSSELLKVSILGVNRMRMGGFAEYLYA